MHALSVVRFSLFPFLIDETLMEGVANSDVPAEGVVNNDVSDETLMEGVVTEADQDDNSNINRSSTITPSHIASIIASAKASSRKKKNRKRYEITPAGKAWDAVIALPSCYCHGNIIDISPECVVLIPKLSITVCCFSTRVRRACMYVHVYMYIVWEFVFKSTTMCC